MSDDDPQTQRFFDSAELGADLSTSSDAISVSFARIDSAEDLQRMATELSRAAEHCEVAARHMLDGEVPRACAHSFAAEGHMRKALRSLEELAIRHSEHAHIDLADEEE